MERADRKGNDHAPGRWVSVAAPALTAGRWLVGIALVAGIASGVVRAAEFAGEEPLPVRDAIGTGIHAYHAGDFHRSYDDLTTAIEAGAEDPRAYYFRGLAALRLGRTSEAEADFTMGADRELAAGGTRRISQSMERVQGPDRLTLERFRSRARLGALQREREAFGRRYSTIEDAASDVRRRRRPEDIRPELVAPGVPAAGPSPSPAVVEEAPPRAAKPAAPRKPTSKPAKEATETFADEPAEDGGDPFADGPTDGSEESEDEQDEEMDAEVEDTEAEAEIEAEVEAASGK